MKVVISTAGRYHLFALARELEKHGCLERIYSGFIWSALAREDAPRRKVTTYPWFRTPYMALGRMPIAPPRRFGRWLETMSCVAQDAYVARRLPPCDVFVGHDGAGLEAGREARRRGRLYIADTGTSHVRFRRDLLREEFARNGVSYVPGNESIYRRQLEEYATADAIAVPSRFVKQSFVAEGVAADKVHIVPYGVRRAHFNPVSQPPVDRFRVLFVGSLSIEKGVRYLLEAFRDFPHPRKELLVVGHVRTEAGPIIASLADSKVEFLGHIPNTGLREIYSSSHVMVLPSVQDGFGMVMAEALACGCPVIASTSTGAPDLFAHGKEGFIVPIRDSRAICDCLTRFADEPDLRVRMSAAAVERVANLGGWGAYGNKYVALLGAMMDSRGGAVRGG
ncbi:MAG: glycosyltransferase family 4 protein [Roseiarcus sp.]